MCPQRVQLGQRLGQWNTGEKGSKEPGGGVNPTDKLICGKSLKTVATFTNFFSTYEIMKITINYTNELTFKDLMNKSNILQLVFIFHKFINIWFSLVRK